MSAGAMTTLVIQLSPAMAARVARCADVLNLSHAELGETAVKLFVRSFAAAPAPAALPPRGPRGSEQNKLRAKLGYLNRGK